MLKNHFDPEGFLNVLTPITLIGRTGEEYGFIVPVYAEQDVLKSGVKIPVMTPIPPEEMSERAQLVQRFIDEDEHDEP